MTRGVKGVAQIDNKIRVFFSEPRPDLEIQHDVESALTWDVRIDDGLIVVDLNDGNVSLRGTVCSAYEKNLAESKAYIAGVESVDSSSLETEWWARDEMIRKKVLISNDDEEVEAAVRDALLIDPRVNSFRPEVHVENGVVTLSGAVGTVKARQAAAQDAANTTGVWRVTNYLKVGPAGDRTDGEIAEDIRAALLADPYVEKFEIDVSVRDGTASLTGTVDSRFEKRHAEDLVARTRGVISIENSLTVSFEPLEGEVSLYDWDVVDADYVFEPLTTSRRADWEIRQDIEHEMIWSPWVDADEVEVAVDDGVATLTGTVDSWSERVQAEEEAIEGGARFVDHELLVRWGPDVPIF